MKHRRDMRSDMKPKQILDTQKVDVTVTHKCRKKTEEKKNSHTTPNSSCHQDTINSRTIQINTILTV